MGPPGCPVHTGHVLFDVRCTGMGMSDVCARCARIKCTAGSRWRRREPLLRWHTGQSGATPDSPVNYSGVASQIPEGGKFGVDLPGAPDTVRWHTGQSGAPDQGSLRLSLALFVEPNSWSFYWLSVNLWHLYNLYTRAN